MGHRELATTPDERRALGVHASAWITGISYATGLAIIGPWTLATFVVQLRPALFVVAAAYAAFILVVASIQRHMQKSFSSTAFGVPQKLTTSGIFKYSLNPIYAAFLIPLAALAAISWLAAAVGIAVYITAMELFVVRQELEELHRLFGKEFEDWQAKTPRWFII